MNRRTFLWGAAITGLTGCSGNGCDKGDPSGPDVGVPPTDPEVPPGGTIQRPTSPVGYSNVGTLNAAEARLIVSAGFTLVQAELIPFDFGEAGQGGVDVANPAAQWDRIAGAAQVARAGGAITWITLVNWNGAKQRSMSDAWFQAQLDTAKTRIGPAGVWLEAVSEPDSRDAKALRWMQMVQAQWPGTTVDERVNVGATLHSRHYCSYESLLAGVKTRGDIVHSTDCTPALASNLMPAEVTEVTREAVRLKRSLILYDTTNAPSANLRVIEAMRAGLVG